MEELKNFIKNIIYKKDDFELGTPWKYSDKSMGVVVPILQNGKHARDYITLPESENKTTFEDLGSITPIKGKTHETKPLFIRSGTVLEGISGQDRALIHSIVIKPEKDIEINVRCVHASRPTYSGGNFKYGGYAPKMVHQNLGKGQSQTWGSVKSFFSVSNLKQPIKHENIIGTSMAQCVGTIKEDDLPNIKKAQMKLDNNIQNILKEVPVLENQIGAIIIGMSGIIGIETFDNPISWKAQYKEAISNYSEELAEKAEQSLFKFDESNIMSVITDFLHNIADANLEAINDCVSIIKLRGFTGEVTINNGHVIHFFLMKKDEDDEPKYTTRPIGYTDTLSRNIGSIGTKQQTKPIIFEKAQYKTLVTRGMKKGFKEIIYGLDKRGGQATWSELKKDTGLSPATLTARLKEGSEIGFFGIITKKDGKKCYTFYKD